MYLRSRIFEILDNISDDESDSKNNFEKDKNIFDADSEQSVNIKNIKDF